jgi:hypothetical protein
MNNGTGYIYAIRAVTINRIKIGYSTDPEVRLCTMQVGSPDILEIIATWPGTEQDERRLHRHLHQWRIHGDWFESSENVLDAIKHCYDNQATYIKAGSEVGLSILQAGFDQALEEGVKAILEHFPPSGHMPHHRIAIQIWDARICPNCQAWTEQTTCPACANQIG